MRKKNRALLIRKARHSLSFYNSIIEVTMDIY